MAGRFAFAVYATHPGEAAVAQFSLRTGIIGPTLGKFALFLMAMPRSSPASLCCNFAASAQVRANATTLVTTAATSNLSPCAA